MAAPHPSYDFLSRATVECEKEKALVLTRRLVNSRLSYLLKLKTSALLPSMAH
jgi:hypothetical protein